MGKMASKTSGVTFAALAGLLVFGCSSSSSNGSTVVGGDGGGGNNIANICPKLSTTDINALLAPPYPAVTEKDLSTDLFECDASGLSIQLETADSDMSLYNTANTSGSTGDAGSDVHPVTGVGDEAYWFAVDDGSGNGIEESTPTFAAHKGSATCYIDTDNDPSKYSMPYVTAAPFQIKESDAAAWAAKAGKVCTDLFAAGGI
jgi:hypothetical protein